MTLIAMNEENVKYEVKNFGTLPKIKDTKCHLVEELYNYKSPNYIVYSSIFIILQIIKL
jgi:hypothetical protein